MMREVTQILGIALIPIALGLSFALPASAETFIEIEPASTTITLPPVGKTVVRVPYTVPEGATDDKLLVDDDGAVRDGLPVTLPDDALTFDVDAAANRIAVTIDNDAFRRAGTYTVTVQVSASAVDGSQLLAFTFIRATAQLIAADDDPIEIERTVWFPELDWHWFADETDPLVVLEAGPHTRMLDLVARPLTTEAVYVTASSDDGTKVARASVAFDLLEGGPPLGPGDLLELVESIEGDPPLSTIQRMVRLSSPQLEQPLDITYSITTRRSRAMIPFVIALGLLFGLLARTLPTRVQQIAAARDRVSRLQLQLEGLRDHPDRGVREAAKRHLNVVRGMSLRDKQLDKRVDEAIGALNAELQRVEAAVAKQRGRLDACVTTVNRQWRVPAGTAKHLRRLRRRLEDGFARARAGDLLGVRTAADDIKNLLASPLDGVIRADAAEIREAATLVVSTLKGVHEVFGIPVATAERIVEDTAQLPSASSPPVGRIEWLHNLTDRTDTLASTVAEAIEQLIAVPQAVEKEKHDAGRRAVSTLRSGSGVAALRGLRSVLKDFAVAVARRQGGGSAIGPTVVTPPIASPALVIAAERAPYRARVAADSAARRWQTFDLLANLGRYAVLVVVLFIVSYGWFDDSWFGTASDIATILMWAFGLDLTAELVMQFGSENPLAAAADTGDAVAPSDQPQDVSNEPDETQGNDAPMSGETEVDSPAASVTRVDESLSEESPAKEPADNDAADKRKDIKLGD